MSKKLRRAANSGVESAAGEEAPTEPIDTPALAEANRSKAQHPMDTKPEATCEESAPPRQSACNRRSRDGEKATEAELTFVPTRAGGGWGVSSMTTPVQSPLSGPAPAPSKVRTLEFVKQNQKRQVTRQTSRPTARRNDADDGSALPSAQVNVSGRSS